MNKEQALQQMAAFIDDTRVPQELRNLIAATTTPTDPFDKMIDDIQNGSSLQSYQVIKTNKNKNVPQSAKHLDEVFEKMLKGLED